MGYALVYSEIYVNKTRIQIYIYIDRWMDGWMDGLMEGWMERWIDGSMDRQRQIEIDR